MEVIGQAESGSLIGSGGLRGWGSGGGSTASRAPVAVRVGGGGGKGEVRGAALESRLWRSGCKSIAENVH